ncbi:MAG: transglycosylase SLT domain-containing protein, partial [Gammaproteobacteria bacterium]|nr:transglycosylase SLT domain-containing protein [Gammaproteobacteria bacterium]
LEVVVPPNREALLSWLREGRGDIAAGFWTGEPREGMTWSRPYHYSQPYLVSRSGEADLTDLAGLRGRRIAVPPDSPAWVWLASRQVENGYTLQGIDDDLVSEEIVDKVALGEFDLAVVDEHRLAVELAVRDDLRKQFAIGEEVPNHWAVRSEDVQLAKALDAFFKKEYRGTVYNITYKKYFENENRIRRQQAERVDRGDGSLSPYDALVRKFGEEYLFDWRLITAQMYQESRFDPKAKSQAGAKGLMQVMPRTAKELGFTNLQNPESGLHAGVKYMDWVRDRFPEDLPVTDRVWFSLAAYNAGVGHVADARRLAAKQGWDRDRWFDNVERAMLLLSKRQYAKQARYGYVRGTEPVNYVQQIRSRYLAYVNLLERQQGKAAQPLSEAQFVAMLLDGRPD